MTLSTFRRLDEHNRRIRQLERTEQVGGGDPGPMGPPGPEGPQGDPGPQGIQGVPGTTGATGAQGPKGDTGATGPASTVPGPQGPQGVQGPAGADSTVPGPQGAQGPKGDTGPASTVPGPAGPPGADSTVPGPQGPQGVKGDTGATGSQGVPGTPGVQGPQGVKGDTGATGTTGATGAQGPIGPEGPEGDPGPQGPAGATGATGSQGPKGDKGDPGTQGIQGPAGTTGAQGTPGVGVPVGGATGQVLAKTSSADYATGWQSASAPAPQPLDWLTDVATAGQTATNVLTYNGSLWTPAAVPPDSWTAVTGKPSSFPPGGTAGGDLAGTYPNPTIGVDKVTASHIAPLTITDAEVAAANKDGAVGTASMRTLGTGATQAAPGAHTHPADTWTTITGKPSTFPPDEHDAAHDDRFSLLAHTHAAHPDADHDDRFALIEHDAAHADAFASVGHVHSIGTWTTMTPLTSPYVNGSAGVPRYRIEPGGVVRLDGTVQRPSGTNLPIYTLPLAARPLIVKTYAISATSAFGRITVGADGVIRFTHGTGTGDICLDGITYPTD